MTSVRVLSGGAAQGLVESLRESFESEAGHRIDGTFGAVGAMRDRLLAGEPADLLILTSALIAGLERDGHVAAGSARNIGDVETAIAIRHGDNAPSITDTDTLRMALLAADAIHLPDPTQATAGIHFARVMRELGIADQVADRLRPAPNGATAMRELAASKSTRPIGCTQVTEILATSGLDLVAPLPLGCALSTTYTVAITSRAAARDAAARLIAMLTDDTGRERRKTLGFA